MDEPLQTPAQGSGPYLQARGRGVRGSEREGPGDGAHAGAHEVHGHGRQSVQQGRYGGDDGHGWL